MNLKNFIAKNFFLLFKILITKKLSQKYINIFTLYERYKNKFIIYQVKLNLFIF